MVKTIKQNYKSKMVKTIKQNYRSKMVKTIKSRRKSRKIVKSKSTKRRISKSARKPWRNNRTKPVDITERSTAAEERLLVWYPGGGVNFLPVLLLTKADFLYISPNTNSAFRNSVIQGLNVLGYSLQYETVDPATSTPSMMFANTSGNTVHYVFCEFPLRRGDDSSQVPLSVFERLKKVNCFVKGSVTINVDYAITTYCRLQDGEGSIMFFTPKGYYDPIFTLHTFKKYLIVNRTNMLKCGAKNAGGFQFLFTCTNKQDFPLTIVDSKEEAQDIVKSTPIPPEFA